MASLKFGYDFIRHLDASGGHLALILDQNGVDFGPPGAVREISRNCARTVAGARFSRFRGCPKRSPKPQKTASPGNLAPGASRKAPGTILHQFCIYFVLDPKIVLKKHRKSIMGLIFGPWKGSVRPRGGVVQRSARGA